MPSPTRSRLLHRALLAVTFLTPIVFLASLNWVRHLPDWLVFLLAGIASLLTVGGSFALSILADRQSDEWQRSGARFANQWGWITGSCLIALLLALPPVHGLIETVSARLASMAHAPAPDRELALLLFVFGFVAVVATQAICTVLLSIGWFSWMSRTSREPS